MATIEPFYQDLGQRIQSRRMSIRMTQEELGLKLQPRLKRTSIANIETGKQRVLSHMLIEFARVLQVSVEELLPKAKSPSATPAQFAGAVERELQEKLKLTDRHLKSLTKKINSTKGMQ